MTRFTEQEYAEVLERTRRKPRSQATTLPAISEKEFQQQVKDLARLLGWKTYHTLRSKGSDPGFPDLIMLRKGRMIVAELKKEGERPTDTQGRWLNEFRLISNRLGEPLAIEVCVWRPSDWKMIEIILK